MISYLNQQKLFTGEHTVYWPAKYESVIKYLKGETNASQNHKPLYPLNVHAIVLAACIGISYKNSLRVDNEKKEIPISAFHNNSLSVYLFLIPILSKEIVDLDYFRGREGELQAISIFEKYAAGGLEILNEMLVKRSLDTPYTFVSDLITANLDSSTDIKHLKIDIF
jgi:dnd system-associated protein 4